MIEAIGFDLDGTLIDSTEAIVASFLHTFDVLNRPAPSRERIVETISVPLKEQFALLAEPDTERAAAVYREYYHREAPATTTLLPGAAETLNRLRDAGIKIGLATSKSRPAAELLLDHLDVLDYFDCLIGPGDVTHPKPHPESIHRLIEVLGAAPATFVFVGDSRFDVGAAHAAGVRCWCVTTGYGSREELEALSPAAIFDNLGKVANSALTDAQFTG